MPKKQFDTDSDTSDTSNHRTSNRSSLRTRTLQGVNVHGLFLEGAGWEDGKGEDEAPESPCRRCVRGVPNTPELVDGLICFLNVQALLGMVELYLYIILIYIYIILFQTEWNIAPWDWHVYCPHGPTDWVRVSANVPF